MNLHHVYVLFQGFIGLYIIAVTVPSVSLSVYQYASPASPPRWNSPGRTPTEGSSPVVPEPVSLNGAKPTPILQVAALNPSLGTQAELSQPAASHSVSSASLPSDVLCRPGGSVTIVYSVFWLALGLLPGAGGTRGLSKFSRKARRGDEEAYSTCSPRPMLSAIANVFMGRIHGTMARPWMRKTRSLQPGSWGLSHHLQA